MAHLIDKGTTIEVVNQLVREHIINREFADDVIARVLENDDDTIKKEIIRFIINTPRERNKHAKWIAWLEQNGMQTSKEKAFVMLIKSLLDNYLGKQGTSTACRQEIFDWLDGRHVSNWKPTVEQMDALYYVLQHYTPEATDRLAWDALKTVEIMRMQLNKLK